MKSCSGPETITPPSTPLPKSLTDETTGDGSDHPKLGFDHRFSAQYLIPITPYNSLQLSTYPYSSYFVPRKDTVFTSTHVEEKSRRDDQTNAERLPQYVLPFPRTAAIHTCRTRLRAHCLGEQWREGAKGVPASSTETQLGNTAVPRVGTVFKRTPSRCNGPRPSETRDLC